MPRKRRKSSFQQKPSLIFTESPVNIVKNVPSPVLCARYPPTATSIPVEELDELTWVSPQFTRVPNTVCAFGRRVHTRHRKSLSTIGTNKENTLHCMSHTSLPNRQNKFKSLKFLGEKTVEESVAEEVNISFDSVSNSEIESGNDGRISEQDSPVVGVSDIDRTSNRRNFRKRCSNNVRDIHSRGINHQSTPLDNCTHGVGIKDNGHGHQTGPDESSLLDLTRLKPKTIMKSPVKRLFASQLNLSDYKNDQNIISTIQTVTDSDCTIEEINHVSETDLSNNGGSDIDNAVPNSDSDLDIHTTSPYGVRRSKRLRLLRQILENGTSPNKDAPVAKVIVPDTPVDKYGWPLRKYQLQNCLLNKR